MPVQKDLYLLYAKKFRQFLLGKNVSRVSSSAEDGFFIRTASPVSVLFLAFGGCEQVNVL